MQPECRLLPEWAPQEAVILAWPDEHTDWQPWLAEVRQTYVEIIDALNSRQIGVVLLVRAGLEQETMLALKDMSRVLIVSADFNDTWVRDYGFLSCDSDTGNRPVDFVFNGWGNKFDASKDNQVNNAVLADLCRLPIHHIDLVAEGGALEIDENGHLLSTASCLFNPQRNGEMNLEQYQHVFERQLGAQQLTVLRNGHLQGDDTDGHIDTLVRFTPDNGLV